jgi:VanZ family protein
MKEQIKPTSRFEPRLRRLIWSVYVLAWTTALLTPQPAEIADKLLGEEDAFYASKTLHVSAYAIMAIVSGWLGVRSAWRPVLLAFLSFHALGTEFFQHFVPYRYPSWTDVGWDHIGILWGIILSWRWWVEGA